jgi:hypothetical protein
MTPSSVLKRLRWWQKPAAVKPAKPRDDAADRKPIPLPWCIYAERAFDARTLMICRFLEDTGHPVAENEIIERMALSVAEADESLGELWYQGIAAPGDIGGKKWWLFTGECCERLPEKPRLPYFDERDLTDEQRWVSKAMRQIPHSSVSKIARESALSFKATLRALQQLERMGIVASGLYWRYGAWRLIKERDPDTLATD